MSYQYGLYEPSFGTYTGHPMDPRTPDPDAARDAALDAFVTGIEKGVDQYLPMAGDRGMKYRTSVYLGECSSEAQAALFKACHAALQDADISKLAEHNAAVAAALRAFIHTVAAEYADDHSGAYE